MKTEISVRIDPYEVLDWWVSKKNKENYFKEDRI